MDLSNFNFGLLDQATRDETLARLSYPFVQDSDWDPFYPIEPAAVGTCQQEDADARASNESQPQGVM
jgi:hypothetical protein